MLKPLFAVYFCLLPPQPPSGGCVLKQVVSDGEGFKPVQPPSGGCVLKRADGRLWWRGQGSQPPSGGCVLKHRAPCHGLPAALPSAYFSQVLPVIQSNGRLLQLQYNGNPKHIDGGWTLNGRMVSASLPQCSPAENFKDGAQIGLMFLLVAIGLWGIVNIKTLLDKFTS